MLTNNLFAESVTSGAQLSVDGLYRYRLWREVGGRAMNVVVFVMLNPSTADGEKDDQTIRKCKEFARQWGFRRLEVVNLFAWRATNPKELPKVADPIGSENDRMIEERCLAADWVICAWGSDRFAARRAQEVTRILRRLNIELRCLRKSKDGNPWHPLYVPYGMPIGF